MVETVYIALGSNLGDREQNVLGAIEKMRELALGDVERSSLYMTDPQDVEDEAEEFVNAIARFDTGLSPTDLLAQLQQIEVALGRPRNHDPRQSRTIDLDIVCFGNHVITEPGLVVPHPRAHTRLFVLMPMVELAPCLVLPGTNRTLRELIAACLSA